MKEIFFKLVRSGLYGTTLCNSDLSFHIDWNQLIFFAQKQTLQGVIADAVVRLPSETNIPLEVREQLMDSALSIAKSHSTLDNKIKEIVKFYNQNDISTVLLKGQGIARCYRNPLMRQCGDIDLFVGNKNYQKACQLAKENLESNNKKTEESPKHYEFMMDHVTVELHRIVATPPSFQKKAFLKWIENEIENRKSVRYIEICGEQICLPSYTFDAFYIFYHAWRHLLSHGIGLRQICDWTMLLNNSYTQIDLISLEHVLHKFKLMRPWQLFGNIAVDYLGLPSEKMPFYNPKLRKKSNKVLDIVLECGNFGQYSKNYKDKVQNHSYLNGKWRSFKQMTNLNLNLLYIVPREASIKFITYIPSGIKFAIQELLHHN